MAVSSTKQHTGPGEATATAAAARAKGAREGVRVLLVGCTRSCWWWPALTESVIS